MNKKNKKHYKLDIIKSPQPIIFGKHTDSSSFYFNEHYHVNTCEIIFLKRGLAKMNVDGAPYELRSGTVILFNPLLRHEETYLPQNAEFISYNVTLGNYLLNGQSNGMFLPGKFPFFAETDDSSMDELCGIVETLIIEYEKKSIGYGEIIKSLCTQLCIKVLRLFDEKYGIYDKGGDSEQQIAVIDIKNFIDGNYSDSELNMADLEKAVHLSKYYISHLFKRSTGVSVSEYIINCRMEKACQLLKDTKLTVLEVAKQSGYSNIYQFHRQFKKRFGSTPVSYRNYFQSEK